MCLHQNNQSVDGRGGGFSITQFRSDQSWRIVDEKNISLDDISATNIAFAAVGYSTRIMDTKCGPTIAVYTISIMSQKLHFLLHNLLVNIWLFNLFLF